MEDRVPDAYESFMRMSQGIVIYDPTRTCYGGCRSDQNVKYSISNPPYKHTSSSNSIFGFSNNLGTDIAIASLLIF